MRLKIWQKRKLKQKGRVKVFKRNASVYYQEDRKTSKSGFPCWQVVLLTVTK